MNRSQWWVDSGQAAQAAQSLVWFVVILFVVAGVVLWREAHAELKKAKRKEHKDGI